MRDARPFSSLLSLLVLLSACSEGTPAGVRERGELANSVEVGEAFDLAVGQRVRVGDGGLVVGFRGVREDSRCPVDVTCVWAGDAAVALSLAIGQGGARTATLHTHLEPRAVRAAGLMVRVVDLAPEVVSTRRIDPADYVVTLVAEPSR